MGPKEVVMCDEKSSEGSSAIRAIKARRRFYVVFISSVKTLNELLKESELFWLFIEVLKTDDLMMLDIGAMSRVGINKVDACGIEGLPSVISVICWLG